MKNKKVIIYVGAATCGRSAGALQTKEAIHSSLQSYKIESMIIETGCIGPCYAEPIIGIKKSQYPIIWYRNVTPQVAKEIIKSYIIEDNPISNYTLGTTGEGSIEKIPYLFDLPIFQLQKRMTLNNCGFIDPTNIDDYIRIGGYDALKKVLLEMTPEQVIDEVKRSGIRGMGGGGFPVGRKWESGYKVKDSEKYVICNADEGDPGAFQDRSVLEGDPHSVIEGMIIAGYTIGAAKGYVYVRAEYPLAVKHLQIAISQCKEKGFLGKNILEKKFTFDLEIFQGAGAFVCGESTALTLSIEGKRGIPKSLPRPRTTEVGIYNKPTLLNNVKTFANIRWIINNGADWFASIGTEKSKGTAVFSLTGKIANCGLLEVPMGTTLREIIYGIGGGIPEGKHFKAVQTGGPSGGCLPVEFLDTPVDFDSLLSAGSMMGSGGMVIMDESTCMVDVARYFLDFIQKESCGQCVPCRLGTKQMLDILEDITKGKGTPQDIDTLYELSEGIKLSSICGLGESAPNPVLTTLKYFSDEYKDHIINGKCAAKVCKDLIKFNIIEDKCTGCHLCFKSCPVGAIVGKPKEVHYIIQDKCTKCKMCYEKCPPKFEAIEILSGEKV